MVFDLGLGLGISFGIRTNIDETVTLNGLKHKIQLTFPN